MITFTNTNEKLRRPANKMGFKISKNTFKKGPSTDSNLKEPLIQPKMHNTSTTSDYESDTDQQPTPANPFADPGNPFSDPYSSQENNTTEATPTHPIKLTSAEEEAMLIRFALGQASKADYEHLRCTIYLAGHFDGYQRAERELEEQFDEAFCQGYAKAVVEREDPGRVTAGFVRGRAREAWGEMVDREARAKDGGCGSAEKVDKVDQVEKKGKFRAWFKGMERKEGNEAKAWKRTDGKGEEKKKKEKKADDGRKKAELRPWFNGLMIPA